MTGEDEPVRRLQTDARVAVRERWPDAGIERQRAFDLKHGLVAVAELLGAAEADDGAVVGFAVDRAIA